MFPGKLLVSPVAFSLQSLNPVMDFVFHECINGNAACMHTNVNLCLWNGLKCIYVLFFQNRSRGRHVPSLPPTVSVSSVHRTPSEGFDTIMILAAFIFVADTF